MKSSTHPEIRRQPSGGPAAIRSTKPLLLHDVTNPSASASAAARRRMIALQSKAVGDKPLVSSPVRKKSVVEPSLP